jgi:hypothetical protein
VRAAPEFQKRAPALVTPMVDEGNQMIADTFSSEQLNTITEFMRRSTALQQRHIQLLREANQAPK